jgi:hypothetical protein
MRMRVFNALAGSYWLACVHDHMAWGVRHWQGLLKGGVAISRIVQITHPTHYLSIAAPLRLSLLLRMQELP